LQGLCQRQKRLKLEFGFLVNVLPLTNRTISV
jgi:hypothetical protein